MAEQKRLTSADWTAAACDALAAGGLAAVAIEPIAARLGTTKGSFYWHFADRDALLEAALLHWERTHTDQVIALVETQAGIPARLRTLLTIALGAHAERPGGTGVELALQPTADHPLVAPVLARVTRRRLAYLTELFAGLGLTPADACRRSLLAYTAYLGHAQLAHATPDLTPAGPDLTDYIDMVISTLVPR